MRTFFRIWILGTFLGFEPVSCAGSTPDAEALLVPAGEIEYEVEEVMIPMRDGVRLYTQIYRPVDLEEPLPILFSRTPYGVEAPRDPVDAAVLGPSPEFAARPYVFVLQDVRGQFRSEGEWQMLRPMRSDPADPLAADESTDAYDTIAWLLENVDSNNGRVGMWGISYDGWQTVMAMADAHPALVAVSPQASPGDWFLGDDAHHFGAFRLNYMFFWIGYMALRRGDVAPDLIVPAFRSNGYDFFLEAGSLEDIAERFFSNGVTEWGDLLDHDNYDEFWKARNPLLHLEDVQPAVLNVAGWFDAEDFRGPVDIWRTVEATESAAHNRIVIGPWKHGGWSVLTGNGSALGDLDFGEATGTRFQRDVELPFFEHHLRGAAKPGLPEALVFETGSNEWHEFDRWPPRGVAWQELYLGPGASAGFEAPEAGAGGTTFVSDPRRPVPYTEESAVLPAAEYMVEDQRYLAGREDVLSFLTPPLEEDLFLAGAPQVELQVSTTGTDADWIVKLVDVYPESTNEVSAEDGESLAGAQILLSADVFRAKYRDSLEDPKPLKPGAKTRLSFPLPDRLHRFRAGHRILVQIHSTWFPLYDRNPQTFMDIYAADEADFEIHDHTVWHEPEAASLLRLPLRK